jgi:hypothetical protein
MGKKFDAIYETVISRSEIGGYLPGDCVKFRTGYKNTETYKHMPSTLQKEVDELDKCGLNIKVVQVGDKQSGFSTGNQFKPAGCVVLTIAADHGGGRTYGRVTVTTDMVDISDGVLVPDKFKKKDVVIIKPKKLEVDPNLITNVTDKGNGKNTPTNLKLAGESKSWESVNELGMIYESLYTEGVDDAEKYRLITALRYAQKTGNASALKIATTNLQTWAKQTQGAYQDPEVLEFIQPQQAQAPAQGAAPQQAQAPAQQPQTNWPPTNAKIFVKPNGFGNVRISPTAKDGYYAVLSDGSVVIPPEMRQDPQIHANYGKDAMTTGNIGTYTDAFNDVRKHNKQLFSQITNAVSSQQPAQAPPTQPVVGESKSWDYTKELAMIYEETLREKFDFKKADRNKNGKLEDWEENIGKKVFGDDEDEDDDGEDNDEDNEDCGEQDEQDACYKKVKSRYDVFPSAYASGALVKCRKVGAKNWGNSKK